MVTGTQLDLLNYQDLQIGLMHAEYFAGITNMILEALPKYR